MAFGVHAIDNIFLIHTIIWIPVKKTTIDTFKTGAMLI